MLPSVNAIILAGEGKDSRKIQGQSKLHLQLDNTPLLIKLITALSVVESINGICIVGPAQSIEDILDVAGLANNPAVAVVPQRDNIFENCEAGVSYFVPEYKDSRSEILEEHLHEEFLLLPIDMPFVTKNEIEEFITNCHQQDLDYGVGMTEESFLKMYYPSQNKPGLTLNFLHLKEGNFRLNNLHLIKPFQVKNREFIAKMYTRRHQSNAANIVSTAYDFLITERMGLGPVLFFIYLEFLALLNHLGFHKLVEGLKTKASQGRVARYTSKLLKARVAIVETSIGSCAADIDSDEDYRAVRQRCDEWQREVSRRAENQHPS